MAQMSQKYPWSQLKKVRAFRYKINQILVFWETYFENRKLQISLDSSIFYIA